MGKLQVLTLAIILLAMGSLSAQDTDSARYSLRVDAWGFFHDNEYFGDRVCGYTLPGFVLEPKLVWTVDGNITLRAGAHWRHYWGATGYPLTTFDTPWPARSDTVTQVHLLPFVQFRAMWGDYSKGILLLLGSLDRDNHRLPLPLFDQERWFATDPEAGFSLSGWILERLDAEVWCDWRDFIWAGSDVKERFTAGVMIEPELWHNYAGLSVSTPLHIVGQHVGGQGLTTWSPVQNRFNFSAGLKINHDWNKSGMIYSCYAMGFSSQSGGKSSKGWGVYPELQYYHFIDNDYTGLNFGATVGWWYGEGFMPLLGSGHFSNYSTMTPGLTYDRNNMLTARLQYRPLSKNNSAIVVEGAIYHYLPTMGSDGAIHPTQTQYSLGCYIHLWPKIRLD